MTVIERDLTQKLLRKAEQEILALIGDATNRLYRLHGARNDIWRELEALGPDSPVTNALPCPCCGKPRGAGSLHP